jgi:hypothetical protein
MEYKLNSGRILEMEPQKNVHFVVTLVGDCFIEANGIE